MCGIVGFTGSVEAKNILLEGLKRLEYRGYDSAGIAVYNGHSIEVVRRLGKVSSVGLLELLGSRIVEGFCRGIGHTRCGNAWLSTK